MHVLNKVLNESMHTCVQVWRKNIQYLPASLVLFLPFPLLKMLFPIKLCITFKTHLLLAQEAFLHLLPVRDNTLMRYGLRGALYYSSPLLPPLTSTIMTSWVVHPAVFPVDGKLLEGTAYGHFSFLSSRAHRSLYLALDRVFNWIENFTLSTFILSVAGFVEKRRSLEPLMTSGFFDSLCRNRHKAGSVYCKPGHEGDALGRGIPGCCLKAAENFSTRLRLERSNF